MTTPPSANTDIDDEKTSAMMGQEPEEGVVVDGKSIPPQAPAMNPPPPPAHNKNLIIGGAVAGVLLLFVLAFILGKVMNQSNGDDAMVSPTPSLTQEQMDLSGTPTLTPTAGPTAFVTKFVTVAPTAKPLATSTPFSTDTPVPTNTPIPTAAPANFGGHWIHNFGTMDITQNGASITGTYNNGFTGGNGTVAGTISGNTVTGTYTIGGSGPLQFVIADNGQTFTGNWGGTNSWCGARSGQAFPSGCSFAGAWTSAVGASTYDLSMQRVDNSISGNYGGNTVTGTISYSGGQTVASGTWNKGGATGPFKFYLFGYNAKQFNGNYNTTFDWCGWRGGASQPVPCLK